ncbi:MAG: nuclear transport factor 2 family protein [Actinomycetota bacterium]|nr:nuclear transport factor 2 family protein [Actinomycetota bacterium]
MSSPTKEVAVETDLAVRRLIARYSQLVDDRELSAATDLFTEDGKVIIGGESHRGQAAVKTWLETGPLPQVHLVTNVVVSYGSHPGTVHAVSDLACLATSGGQTSIVAAGRYHDTMTGEGRSWKFSQRIIKLR